MYGEQKNIETVITHGIKGEAEDGGSNAGDATANETFLTRDLGLAL